MFDAKQVNKLQKKLINCKPQFKHGLILSRFFSNI